MSQAAFVIGRFEWVRNRGGGAGRDSFRLRTGRTGRAMGNVRGLPQVMFKVVPNGGCKGAMGLAAQLGYVVNGGAKVDHGGGAKPGQLVRMCAMARALPT